MDFNVSIKFSFVILNSCHPFRCDNKQILTFFVSYLPTEFCNKLPKSIYLKRLQLNGVNKTAVPADTCRVLVRQFVSVHPIRLLSARKVLD